MGHRLSNPWAHLLRRSASGLEQGPGRCPRQPFGPGPRCLCLVPRTSLTDRSLRGGQFFRIGQALRPISEPTSISPHFFRSQSAHSHVSPQLVATHRHSNRSPCTAYAGTAPPISPSLFPHFRTDGEIDRDTIAQVKSLSGSINPGPTHPLRERIAPMGRRFAPECATLCDRPAARSGAGESRAT